MRHTMDMVVTCKGARLGSQRLWRLEWVTVGVLEGSQKLGAWSGGSFLPWRESIRCVHPTLKKGRQK